MTLLESRETMRLPSESQLLVSTEWKRKGGGVELHVKSPTIRELFSGLSTGEAPVKSKYGFLLFPCKTLPKVVDISFDHPQLDFFVPSPEGYGGVNLTFLRAVDLHTGVVVKFAPIVTDQEQKDMKRALRRGVVELFKDYIAESSDEFELTARELFKGW